MGRADDLLFEPLVVGGLTFPNRLWAGPMCQYSASDGLVGDWHLVHLGSVASGRPGLVMAEASAVTPDGRITLGCAGIWETAHALAWKRIVDFVHGLQCPIGIQLSHAGRKASATAPWEGGGALVAAEGGWTPLAPSPLPYPGLTPPVALTPEGLEDLVHAFAAAARRALDSGFDVIELQIGHGYLLHQFLSPVTNQRTDGYGGSAARRARFPLAVVDAVRAAWPAERPLFVRLSVSDLINGGFDVADALALTRSLRDRGVDLIDVTSGGIDPEQSRRRTVEELLSMAAYIKNETQMPLATGRSVANCRDVSRILDDAALDAVLVARQVLRSPRWPLDLRTRDRRLRASPPQLRQAWSEP